MFPSVRSSVGRLVSLALALGAAACGDLNGAPAMTPDNGGQPGTPAPNAACPSLGGLKPPAVPAQLEPPAGATLMLRYRAEGTQIYTCKATEGAATGFAWSFKAPQATLLDDGCKPVGTHFAGPTWKLNADESAVIGAKAAEAPSPSPNSIPWLLLKATSTNGQGLMTSVVAVQRVDTVGGVAPADQCSAATVGTELKVPYTATYYFYKN
ncbi:MAG TPA: DUF3455 domain-containing protein [Polyangia bacterium]|nr:DUF3455 domain-containing protein [Polyangia bacterium]